MSQDPPRCDQEVFDRGEQIAILVMDKWEAERLVEALRLATGDRWDWHFCGGRVVLLRLPAKARQCPECGTPIFCPCGVGQET